MKFETGKNYQTKIYTVEEFTKMRLSDFELINKEFIQEGIKWYAIGGTMLGAIRHKGVIPWDVDFDMAMIYQDYKNNQDKIRKIAAKYGYHLVDRFDFPGLSENVLIKVEKYFINYRDKLYRFSPSIGIPLGVRVKRNSHHKRLHMSIVNKLLLLHSAPFEVIPRRRWKGGSKELTEKIIKNPYIYNYFAFVAKFIFPKFVLNYFVKRWFKQDLKVDKKNNNSKYNKMILNYSVSNKDLPFNVDFESFTFNNTTVNISTNWKEQLDKKYGKDWSKIPEKNKQIMKGLVVNDLNDEINFVPFNWKY